MAAAGSMMFGRATYEEFAAFWPNQVVTTRSLRTT